MDAGHTVHMLDVRDFKAQDLRGLSSEALAAVAEKMLAHIGEQSKRIDSQAQAIKWRDAKIESIAFQLARFKAGKFGARTARGDSIRLSCSSFVLHECIFNFNYGVRFSGTRPDLRSTKLKQNGLKNPPQTQKPDTPR